MSEGFDPNAIDRFVFLNRRFDPASGSIELDYALDEHRFTEHWQLPGGPFTESGAVEAALDLLHWIAGISYFKAACPSRIEFADRAPDAGTAAWLSQLYRHGLGEFAWVNRRPELMELELPGGEAALPPANALGLRDRALLPVGGGKDSLLAGDLLNDAGKPFDAVFVGGSPVIARSAESLGVRVRNLTRQIDPSLFELNRRGALNGHVPITAIISAALVVYAVAADYNAIVMANEASAEEGNQRTVAGVEVNHQWSKSLAFETALGDWIHRFVATDLDYFSLLRPYSEMAIMQAFAGRRHLHGCFTSCNRNFTLQALAQERIWCRDCPKCRFVALGLATQMPPSELVSLMGDNLLADPCQSAGILALAGLGEDKPFECVGTVAESRAALQALADQPQWASLEVVQEARKQLAAPDLTAPSLERVLAERGPHRIPPGYAGVGL